VGPELSRLCDGKQPMTQVAREVSPEAPAAGFVRVVKTLMDDAIDRGEVECLVDVLSWALANFAHQGGPQVAGDIVRRLGSHMGALAELDQAQVDAEQTRKEGVKSH